MSVRGRRWSEVNDGGQLRVRVSPVDRSVEHLNIDDLEVAGASDDARVLSVNDALEKLAAVDEEKAQLVKLRYFAGLTLEEAAAALDIAEPTARRWWAYARAWLLKEMNGPTA